MASYPGGLMGMTGPQRRQLEGDLRFLDEHNAIEGIGAIVRERRRQIEELGYDASHNDGREISVLGLAYGRASEAMRLASLGCEPVTAAIEAEQCGALAAAAIDVLKRACPVPAGPPGQEQP
jgi:hypothetical protein